MISIIGSDFRRIVGRRGTFFTAVFLVLVAIGIGTFVEIREDSPFGGTEFLGHAEEVAIIATITAILVGALTGTYDQSQGTMRYLIMTGVPRMTIYASRVIALILAVLLAILPFIIVALTVALLANPAPGNELSWEVAALFPFAVALEPLVFGLVGLSIGMLFRSNGAGIAVALGFYLGSAMLAELVESQFGERASNLLLPLATRFLVLGWDTEFSQIQLGGIIAAWLVVFLGVGSWRLHRDEY